MKRSIRIFFTLLVFLSVGTFAQGAESAEGFTIRGTAATGIASANAAVTITGADGTPLSQSTTTGADGTYSITFPSAPTFPIQVNATLNGLTQSNVATSTSTTTRNLNPVTTAATNAAINAAGGLSSVTETGLNNAGQGILSSALGGGVSYASFSSSSFTARTSATDFTQTASVADVFLDTLGELATSQGTNLSTLLTTQTTPLLEDDSFSVNLATNLAKINTVDSLQSVVTRPTSNLQSALASVGTSSSTGGTVTGGTTSVSDGASGAAGGSGGGGGGGAGYVDQT